MIGNARHRQTSGVDSSLASVPNCAGAGASVSGCTSTKSLNAIAPVYSSVAQDLLDGHNLVKLEVLAEQKALFLQVIETLVALDILVKEGFEVMVYTNLGFDFSD